MGGRGQAATGLQKQATLARGYRWPLMGRAYPEGTLESPCAAERSPLKVIIITENQNLEGKDLPAVVDL